MSDILEIIIPGLVVALIFAIIFGFFAYIRYLRYKETIALAEKGLLRQSHTRNGRDNNSTLRWGIVITGIGFALSCSLWPIAYLVTDRATMNELPFGFFGPWMFIGLLPIFFGISLIIIHAVSNGVEPIEPINNHDESEPIPPHKI